MIAAFLLLAVVLIVINLLIAVRGFFLWRAGAGKPHLTEAILSLIGLGVCAAGAVSVLMAGPR